MPRHPLQRLASPSRSVSALVHGVGLVSFFLSFRFLVHFASPVADQYGWHFQYLTIIGLALASACFALGLAADVLGVAEQDSHFTTTTTLAGRLFAAKNGIAVLAAPLEVLISLLYWGIRAVDPKLLYPSPELQLGLVEDVGFHLVPAVALAADLLLLSPPWTVRAYSALGLSMALAMGYWYWVEVCFGKNGVYPYPIMAILSTSQRAGLFVFSGGLFTLSSIALKWLYGRINKVPRMESEAGRPLKKVQ